MPQYKKRKFAVFDIDGTVFRSSLLIELVDALIMNGIFSKKVRKIYAKDYQNWLDRKDSYEKYINSVILAFESNIRGVSEKKFNKVCLKVIEFHKNRLYRFSRDLIKKLKNKNYYLLAISHSPMYIVGRFAKQIGFNKVYGRLLESKKGKFTGKTLFEDLIFDKSKILLRAVKKENLTFIGSIGVGDTESDIPFLKLVKYPICMNPNIKLYNYAKKYNWTIVVERKDVIYKFGRKIKI
ncbi:MAG: HAD-IB family phosphatase [Patescibacteria group bacterium]|nr:HAD-IB family phosphatase [Patescibacteria group bacterium]